MIECLEIGMQVLVFDNLYNSSEISLQRVQEITGKPVIFVKGDITEKYDVVRLFQSYSIKAVLHFAGLKSPYESISMPIQYYKTNVLGTMNLIQVMSECGCNNLVFSSSAAVYGAPEHALVTESQTLNPLNPYGRTKLHAECLIADFCRANPDFKACLLRYFNPVGNHPSGLIGEDPHGMPNNLMPYLLKVLGGQLPYVNVFGNDYDTNDGTGVRDFIHVVDLAKGHVAALKKLFSTAQGCFTYNMGTGTGYSVFDMISTLESVSGKELPFRIASRRQGDAASVVADPTLANRELKWKTECDLQEMCRDAWKWQVQNQHGYKTDLN